MSLYTITEQICMVYTFLIFFFILALIIAFEQRDYVVSEDDGTITVGVTVVGSTDLTLQFGYD